MSLTAKSTGFHTYDTGIHLQKKTPLDKVIAVAGNPNVGKSTLFNSLTGLKQHTGNWAGKTISSAQGYCKSDRYSYVLVDIPGTCSLVPHSAEEEVASDFLCFGNTDGVVVVCDGTCVERGLNLLLQILELTPHVMLCVNLLDEAARKNISIDLPKLEQHLGIPVIGTIAHCPRARRDFLASLEKIIDGKDSTCALRLTYAPIVEEALSFVQKGLAQYFPHHCGLRWLSLMLLEEGYPFGPGQSLPEALLTATPELKNLYEQAWEILRAGGYTPELFSEYIVTEIAHKAAAICGEAVTHHSRSPVTNPPASCSCCASGNSSDTACPSNSCCTAEGSSASATSPASVVLCNRDTSQACADRKLDRLLTSPLTGYPIMLLFLLLLFWITIVGANYPSQLLSYLFTCGENLLDRFMLLCRFPDWLREPLVYGMFRTLGWVVSVMLPPMMIFFPLFALLEDAGFLPRMAYNLDYCFQKCRSCGKQALTMAMGFGCNAAGVVGCRIIDSPRERLIAILTNSFVPCNGRFPMLIAMISMFLLSATGSLASSLSGALCLTALILSGIAMTFLTSRFLSATLLKGVPSSFVLELPPYRKPRVGSVILHSLSDRVSFLLGRALISAAPAGLLLWVMANMTLNGTSLLNLFAGFLEPFARLLGLDGVILMAFILGLPANEIVLPIILMAYSSQGSLTELNNFQEMKYLLTANGWTWQTAVSTCIFSLMHWPCATTLLTIKKETGSLKWTLLSILLPLVCGVLLCMIFTAATGP